MLINKQDRNLINNNNDNKNVLHIYNNYMIFHQIILLIVVKPYGNG